MAVQAQATRNRIDLSAGPIEHADKGDGPPIVLLHGLLMDASLWQHVLEDLSVDHRCIAPALPLGAHRYPMRAETDFSLPAIARLVRELLEELDLEDVTLVGSDTGGAVVQLVAGDGDERITRIVLVSCDAFDNRRPRPSGRSASALPSSPAARC
jgi:pimeloyl-ACP methyl ester carboxylesterase